MHVIIFNVHLAQFDIAPTRTCAGISLICDYLIIIGLIIIIIIITKCKICDVTLDGGLINVTTCNKDGGGVKNHEIRVTLFMDGPLLINCQRGSQLAENRLKFTLSG